MAPETAAHRGYLRRDESVREEITDLLARDALLDAGDIEILVERGVVTLAGCVADGLQRLRAADLAESVDGVRSLRNALVVNQAW